ncbi:MAG: amino acid adenylation domain-containing protein [Acidobacteria bacterium]|nr:amino acid adenylation domain-containing protein [Acidobacteriota bacterium]
MTTPATRFSLSHAEKRIYLTERLHPGSTMWNLPYLVRFHENVEEDLLVEAIRRVVRANPGLRLRFTEVDGEIRQYVSDDGEIAVERLNLGAGGETDLQAWVDRAIRTPFAFFDRPLYRFALLRLANGQHAFYYCLHHIVADGGSCALVVEQVMAAYRALRAGQPDPAEPRPSFLDVLDAERAYLASPQCAEDGAYWHGLFPDLPDPIDLTGRPETDNLEIRRVRHEFSGRLTEKIHAFCADRQTSPFRLVLAALAAVLGRETQHDDLAVGTATLNRYPEAMEKAVGMFVSSVPIRLRPAPEAGIDDLLGQVREAFHGIRRHDRYPYDRFISEIRDRLGESPNLMDVTLVQYMRADLGEHTQIEFLCPSNSLNTLTIYLDYGVRGVRNQPVRIMADFRADRLTRERTLALLEHLETLLSDAMDRPGEKLHRLQLLSGMERHRVLAEFNSARQAYPENATVHELIERQVLRTPNQTALVYRNQRMTYAELNRSANRLARALQARGACQGGFVGILAERSIEIIVAQLATLKSGAAVMPIDAKYPADRVRFMLEDSQAPVLLTQQAFLGRLDIPPGTAALDLDDPALFQGDDTDLPVAAAADDLFALIYTSGSTGTPKGVMLEHRSMVNFITWFAEVAGITETDQVSKHTSFSFDVSNAEIYPALIRGATLHIIPDDIRLSLNHLNDYFEKNRIGIAFFTTQLGEQFMDLIDNRSLRLLHVAGEKLRIYRKRGYQLLNGYGPTECSVYTTFFPVDRDYENIPIGKPLPNYRVFILDRHGNPQPVGAPGELCVGGVALARGYLNRPEKTAEVFVDNPVLPGQRMYRTGDLACWLPDGNIQYLGRMDRQVKLRGFRIELGEVEQAFLAQPGIREAAVVDRKDANGRIFLCAYVTAPTRLDLEALRRELGKTLPEFMIPARFMQLDAMPINPNGKIDRKRLPEPEPEDRGRSEFKPPRTPMEKALARLWQEVLHLESVGVHDEFFHIGGDSLKAVLLQVRVEKELEADLSLQDLFRRPVLGDLAAFLEGCARKAQAAVTPAPAQPFYPATPAQKQLYILSRLNGIDITYNIPLVVRLEGRLDRKRLADAFEALVDRHEPLRTSFDLVDGHPVQIVHPKARLKLLFQEAAESELESVIRGFVRPFQLEKAPLLRVLLVCTGPERHVLLCDVHHIVFDGISIGPFLNDLAGLYGGRALAEPPFQFKDYVVWRESAAQAERLRGKEAYWLETFRNPPVLEFPTDRPRKQGADFAGGACDFVMDPLLAGRVKTLARKNQATLHHVLLAALQVLVSRYTGEDDVVVGTSMGGRTVPGTEDLVGMFVNTLPVRTQPRDEVSFRALLGEVRETMLSIYANQDVSIDRVYEQLNINRGPGRHPLFDINLVLQNMEQPRFEAGGLRCDVALHETGTAKFDISLTATECAKTIRFHMEYRRNLFDPDTMDRLAKHFLRILEEAADDPDRRVRDIEMLYPEEKRFLLEDLNDTAAPPPPFGTVCEAIAGHARRDPDHVAVVDGRSRMSYGELNRRADRLAVRLQADGVGRDVICAVATDRSAEAVVGMLAILKAGGAYVGVDPAYPADRIQFILEDTGAPVVLGRRETLERIPGPCRRLAVDDETLLEGPDVAPEAKTEPSDLAYVIFTSGSTGMPKGVMIEHRSMCNFIHWYASEHRIDPAGRCAEFAAFSFDVSVVQVFAPLVSGAELHIIPEELRLSPPELNRYFEAQGITHAHFPTQFAEQFMHMVDNHSLRRLVVGGDALKNYKLGRFTLVNEYGPSETTMASTSTVVDRLLERVSIGKPVANTRVYILSRNGRLQPVGVPGELCIAGAGVSRGYLHRPELTAEKFVADPFVPGERMYRTGDLARVMPDGNLDFIGRLDFQVKIRGYRVELGEIEKRLAAGAGIRECVVAAKQDPGGGKFLCAYYTADETIPPESLKALLSKELPEYMVPAYFVRLEKLPLNRNGKVERKALPDVELTAVGDHQGPGPRTPAERLVFAAWEKVFGFSGIGVFDNFFQIGGDSLKVIALMAELQSRFDVNAGDLFTHQTIAEQAQNLKELTGSVGARLARLREVLAAPDLSADPAIQAGLALYRERIRELASLDLQTRREYAHVLLTGATGTLGVYLLRDLLLTTAARVTALVRGPSDPEARERLAARMVRAFGPAIREALDTRLTVLAGDLPAERLGLAGNVYQRLAGEADAVLHAAADTRHLGEYAEFQRANVLSTRNLIRFARDGRPKDLHHVSTTSVSMGTYADRDAVLFTEFDADLGQRTDHVYIRSKQEAEKAVLAARSEGLSASIYRAGNITFDSGTGALQENVDENAFFQQVKAYLMLGAVPDRFDERNLSFVDQTSRAILALFDRPALANRTFHIENPHHAKLSEVLTAEALGLNLRRLPLETFIDLVVEHCEHKGFREPIERLLLHLGWLDLLSKGPATPVLRPTELTEAVLARVGFHWPRVEPGGMARMIRHALRERIGFLGGVPAFTTLDGEILAKLAARLRPEHGADDTEILWEGEPNTRVFILADGNVEISKRSHDGWIGTMYVAGPGALLGLENLPGNGSARRTAEPVGEAFLLSLEVDDLRRLIREHPEITLGLLRELSGTIDRLETLNLAMA